MDGDGNRSGGWENAISTKTLATHCVFCGRALRDPISVDRGYGPECAEKHWMPHSVPTSVDPAGIERAMAMAPAVLREAWERIGGAADESDAAWRVSPETRRQMLSIGLHYGALAVSFGPAEASVVRGKVDSAKQCIAAVQGFAQAAGYAAAAERMREKYIEKLEGNLIVFRRSKREGYMGVHTPYSPQWLSWCNANSKYFVHKEYVGKLYFRYFDEKKLGFIANALSGIFGDTLLIDPDGNMVALPTMHIEPEEKIAPAAPTPPVSDMPSTDEVEKYAVPDTVKLGDLFELPDGTKQPIQYIDPKRGFIGVGASKGKYAFFSFEQVKTITGKEVAKDLYTEIVRLSDQAKEPPPPPLPARATKRALPEGLMEHQVTGVQFIDERYGRALIADEMGLGKTCVAAVAINAPATVVCPALLKMNWLRELARWRPDLSVAIVSGSEEPSAVQKAADVIIINYDILPLHLDLGWLAERKNQTIIADEAQYLKNLEIRWNADKGEFEVPMATRKAVPLSGYLLRLPKQSAEEPEIELPVLDEAATDDGSYALVRVDERGKTKKRVKLFGLSKSSSGMPVASVKPENEEVFRAEDKAVLRGGGRDLPVIVQGTKMKVAPLPERAVPKVRRASAFYELWRDVPSVILLTGTPIMNRVKELFPLIHLIDPRTWKNSYQFCVKYCGGHYEQMGPKQIFLCDGRTNSEELFRLTNNITILRRTADVLNLPEKRRGSMSVALEGIAAQKYDRQVKEFLKWVDDNGGPKAVMRARRAEAIVKMTRLRETVAEGKVPATLNWIERHWTSTGRPLVVMGTNRTAFEMLMKGIDALNAEYQEQVAAGDTPDMQAPIRYGSVLGGMGESARQAAIDDFQAGNIDVIFYSIALATGTTLTRAQDMVFFERAWRPGDLSQAEARIYRKGQKNQCMITYIDAEGTIDGKIAMLLANKIEAASAVIEGVNLTEQEASDLVFGELFNIGGIEKNPAGDTISQIADSWFSPLPM